MHKKCAINILSKQRPREAMLVPACSARVATPPRLLAAHMSHAELPLSNRRALLACSLLPLLLPPPPAHALPFFLSARSAVQVSELASPSVCQARLRDQDFAVITYVRCIARCTSPRDLSHLVSHDFTSRNAHCSRHATPPHQYTTRNAPPHHHNPDRKHHIPPTTHHPPPTTHHHTTPHHHTTYDINTTDLANRTTYTTQTTHMPHHTTQHAHQPQRTPRPTPHFFRSSAHSRSEGTLTAGSSTTVTKQRPSFTS